VVGWPRTGHAVALLAREHVELVEAAREQLVKPSPADLVTVRARVRVRVIRVRVRAQAWAWVRVRGLGLYRVKASPADRAAEETDGAYAGRQVGAQLVRIDLGTAGHADGFERGQEAQRRQAARRDLGQLVKREAREPRPRRREAEAQGNVGEPCGLRRGWGHRGAVGSVCGRGCAWSERADIGCSVCRCSVRVRGARAQSRCRAGAAWVRYRAQVHNGCCVQSGCAQTCAELKSISGSTEVPCAACRTRRGARTRSAWKRTSSRAASRQSWHTAIATCSAPNESWPSHAGAASKGGGAHTAISVAQVSSRGGA